MGAALRSRPLDARAGPSRRFGAFGGVRDTCEAAETLRTLARKAQRTPLGTGEMLPGRQKERLSPRKPRTRSFAMGLMYIAKLLVVKTQAKLNHRTYQQTRKVGPSASDPGSR